MNEKKRWGRINWPWEYEIILLCLLVGTFVYVAYIDYTWRQSIPIELLAEMYDPFAMFLQNSWLFVMVFGVVVHIFISFMSPRYVSTPVWLLFAPPLLGLLCWRYIIAAYKRTNLENALFSGSVGEGLFVVIVLLGIAILVARVRMERVAFAYRDVNWEVDARPHKDQSLYKELLIRIQPWFYLPRRYRASEEGIVIEGWSFVIPIHFHDVRNIGARKKGDVTQTGFYVAKSINELVAIDVTHTKAPLLIAPENQAIFTEYCRKYLKRYHAKVKQER